MCSASTATIFQLWSRPSTARASLAEPKPRVIICDTQMAQGVPFLEARDRNHFMRVEPRGVDRSPRNS